MTSPSAKTSLAVNILRKSMGKNQIQEQDNDEPNFLEVQQFDYPNFKHVSREADSQFFHNGDNSNNLSRKISSRQKSYDRSLQGETSLDEVTLLQLHKMYNITEEEAIIKFFQNLRRKPENRDNFIRDLDEYFFKAKPKFSPKLISILLEGDVTMNIPGILNIINEQNSSFMSTCSIIQLLSKFLDYQKNVYAESFIREIAKIDPNKIRSINFEKLLKKESAEPYRLSILSILQIYVERRRTLKSTTSNSNSSFALTIKKDKKAGSKIMSEEELVKKIIFDKKIQKELLDFIKIKQSQTASSVGQALQKTTKQQKSDLDRSMKGFFVLKKQKFNEELQMPTFEFNIKETSSSSKRNSLEEQNSDSIQTGRISTLSRNSQYIDFAEQFINLQDFHNVYTLEQIRNLLPNSDNLKEKESNQIEGNDFIVRIVETGLKIETLPLFNQQLEEFILRNIILNRKNVHIQIKQVKMLEQHKELIEVTYQQNVKVFFVVTLIYTKREDGYNTLYIWQESDSNGELRSDFYLGVCICQNQKYRSNSSRDSKSKRSKSKAQLSEEKSLNKEELKENSQITKNGFDIYIRVKNGFFKNNIQDAQNQRQRSKSRIQKQQVQDENIKNFDSKTNFTFKLQFENNGEIGTRSTTTAAEGGSKLYSVIGNGLSKEGSKQKDSDSKNSDQVGLGNAKEEQDQLLSLKCKYKLLETICDILIFKKEQNKLNESNKLLMNVEFDFIS